MCRRDNEHCQNDLKILPNLIKVDLFISFLNEEL